MKEERDKDKGSQKMKNNNRKKERKTFAIITVETELPKTVILIKVGYSIYLMSPRRSGCAYHQKRVAKENKAPRNHGDWVHGWGKA